MLPLRLRGGVRVEDRGDCITGEYPALLYPEPPPPGAGDELLEDDLEGRGGVCCLLLKAPGKASTVAPP